MDEAKPGHFITTVLLFQDLSLNSEWQAEGSLSEDDPRDDITALNGSIPYKE